MFFVDVTSISFKAGLATGFLMLHVVYSLIFALFLHSHKTPTRENPMPVFIAGIADPEERRKWDEAD